VTQQILTSTWPPFPLVCTNVTKQLIFSGFQHRFKLISNSYRPVVSAYAAWHQMVPICTEWWCTKANEATQTHCYNPVTPAYRVLAYYAHQEDPVNLASGGLEKTTRSSPHHVAQYRPTGSETTPPCAPWSSRFGSEPPSVEDDVDVWRYEILRVACQKRRRRVWLEQTTSCVNLCLFSTL